MSIPDVLRFARLAELPRYARRAVGLRHVRPADFLPEIDPAALKRAREIASSLRGDGPPAILVLGVLPRSGTNFVRDVLGLHPDVEGSPGRLYEFPMLDAADAFMAAQADFVARFPRNAEVLGPYDVLATLCGGWMARLQTEAGPGRRLLLKSPHVRNLPLVTALFPGDRVVLVLRDGRDVITSSLGTFGRGLGTKRFGQLAWEWRCAAEAILAFDVGGSHYHPDVQVVRYEHLVEEPDTVLPGLLSHVGLDAGRFDRAAFDALPVRGSSLSVAKGNAAWSGMEKPADFKPVKRWEAWSDRRKAAFTRIAGDTVVRAGYAGAG